MRVLWVYDGLSVHHVKLADCLARRTDMSLEVICRWEEQPPLDRSLIPLTNLACKSKLDFEARKTIRTRVQMGRYDIVSAYTGRALANVLAACRGVPFYPKILGYRGTSNRLHRLDPTNWITFWHPRLSKVVCVSHATKLALQTSGLHRSKLVTVWEGCGLDPAQALPRSARAEFDIPAAAFVVGLIANMRPVKGADLLLRAALQLADLPNVYWLLIGDVRDPRVHELAQDPRIARRVRLPGPRPHAGRYASLFDLYTSPSRMEGMSMSVMEAMTVGICPVVTDVGGSRELVRDQQDGLVVSPDSPAALARAIRFLHDSPRRRQELAESAQHVATTRFSIEAWAERLHGVYAEACVSHRARAA